MTRVDRILAAIKEELEKGRIWLEADGLTEIKLLVKLGGGGIIRAVELQPNFHAEKGRAP